jgi:hypothetical protein
MTNDRFPGLPDYTGPTAGLFFGVHHSVLFEYSHDINGRLAYVDTRKPCNERLTRRRHIVLLKPEDGEIPAGVWAEGYKLWAKGGKLWAEGYKLRAEGDKLWAEGDKLWAECDKLRAEGDKLWAEGDKLLAEGGKLLAPYRAALELTWLKLVPGNTWNGKEIVFGQSLIEE